ncbi:RHS repeat domain-containing protein [Flectobacillus major]|uniref:RHS repeat domain-containing protein n=1 Tax=Flectobacillus major TaxID=103 RepID=UPI00041A40EC|nr:RHS repeat-associated core domain-containing protein [Flectobacillus major]
MNLQIVKPSLLRYNVVGLAFVVKQRFEYNITDHLGNLGIAKITQANAYGVWGEDLPTLSYQNTSNLNNFKFTGKESLQGTGYTDFGARWYDNIVPRFITIDPLAEKNHFESGYVYIHNSPLKYIDLDGRDGVLIVFPDYKISTPVGKVGGLGHAGVLLIDNKTGLTKYYEYGRYDNEGKGYARTVSVSNVKIGKDGKPTEASLNKVLGQISKKSGNGTRIEGAYVESDNFDAMNNYASGKVKEKDDPKRKSYNLANNNCGTFACDVLNQDPNVKDQSPSISDPRPNSIVQEYQGTYGTVEYNPKTGGTKETVDKSRYQEILDKMKSYFKQ